MTDAERIIDAMGELSEDLVDPVANLRAHPSQRRLRRWLAIAACLVLVAGLGTLASSFGPFFANSENIKPESQNDVTPSGFIYSVKVLEVHEDHLVVIRYDPFGSASSSSPFKVLLDTLEEVPELAVGDRIIVYYDGIIHEGDKSTDGYIDDVYYIEKVGSE